MSAGVPPHARPSAGNPLRAVALAALGAGLAATAVRLGAEYEHGIWLVAYLLLVGFLAPWLIVAGERRLGGIPGRSLAAGENAAFWALGTLLVPIGVLADARIAVVVGAVALLTALGRMAVALHERAGSARTGAVIAVGGLLVLMAISTAIGVALAWDSPWLS